MRLTPQPQSSNNTAHEVTHISDSMPGTAATEASLRKQLAQAEETYKRNTAALEAEVHELREREVTWDKQQTKHEILISEHRDLVGKFKILEKNLETEKKNNETLHKRNAERTTEARQITVQLEEQRATHILSEDEKVAEITRLRKELSATTEQKDRALRNAESTNKLLEYTNDVRRDAEQAASSSQSTIAVLTAANVSLEKKASGEAAKLKALHLNQVHDSLKQQLRRANNEIGILKKTLLQREDELAREKMRGTGRMGVGTRAQSVTPQPRIRSRAGSPMGGRVSNLRKE